MNKNPFTPSFGRKPNEYIERPQLFEKRITENYFCINF